MAGTSYERDNSKKTTYDWDEYFMAFAFLAAKRSKDPCTQVGACIVNNDKRIVGTGYNGMPTGCSDDEFPWKRGSRKSLDAKRYYVCHAEVNAILNKNSSNVKDCIMYVALFPCNKCAQIIIQSGIKTVIYVSDKHAHKVETKAAKRMFDAAGVTYRQYIPKNQKIEINFNDINSTEMNFSDIDWIDDQLSQPSTKKTKGMRDQQTDLLVGIDLLNTDLC